MSEKVLDEYTWKDEAQAVINDVKDHVKLIETSKNLKSDHHRIFLNITTEENKNFCVELSPQGFRIVGKSFDTTNVNSDEYFETPYSLLNSISEGYKDNFAKALQDKLLRQNE